jgi:predicted deacylase
LKELPSFRTGKPRVEQGYLTPIDGVELPFTIIEGHAPGPCLLITAGVHASEYCSIEAAVRMQKTRPEDIRGTLVVMPILNGNGFRKRSIYIMPEDGKNLNRQFPGRADGTLSEQLAHWLTSQVFTKVDAYLDLHGGDLDESLMPFTIYPRASEASKAMAEAFGIPVAIASQSPNHSIAGAWSVGVPSLLPEVSGNGLWNDDLVRQMTDGIERVMKHLGMLERPVTPAPQPEFVTMWVPMATVTGLWYSAHEVGAEVAEGQMLGEIKDVFGKSLATITSEKAGKIVYRLTALSVNEGEALLGVGTPLKGQAK